MKKEMTKKRKIILAFKIIVMILVLAVFAYLLNTYRQIKSGELVKFQGHFYTKEELRQIIPPQYEELTEPVNTVEDTYTKFRSALLDGRIEEALGYIREQERENYKSDFNNPETLDLYIGIPPFSELKFHDEIENFQKGYTYTEEGKIYNINFKLNQKTGLWEIFSI